MTEVSFPICKYAPASDPILNRQVVGNVLLAAANAPDAGQGQPVDVIIVSIHDEIDSSGIRIIPDQVITHCSYTL